MLTHKASLILLSAFAVACGSGTVTSESGAGGAGGAALSSTGSSGVGGSAGGTGTGGGTTSGSSVTSSTGTGGGTPCLEVEVNTEPDSHGGGGGPSGPCEIKLPDVIANVDLDSLYVEIDFVDARAVVLHQVGDLGGCLDDSAAYFVADGFLNLCPATCETLKHATVSLIVIKGDCFN